MDRNTVIGLVLIGTILATFTIFNRPSKEEQKANERARKAETEVTSKVKKQQTTGSADKNIPANLVVKKDSADNPLKDANGNLVYVDTLTKRDTVLVVPKQEAQLAAETKPAVPAETIRLQNKRLIVDLTTQGGQVEAVYLKEFETYRNYIKKDGKITPLKLFRKGDAKNELVLYTTQGQIRTSAYVFHIEQKTDKKVVFAWEPEAGKKVRLTYQLNDNAYDLDYTVNLSGFDNSSNYQDVKLNWDVAFRKTERLFTEQRRVSTICYDQAEDGFNWLSETQSDYLKPEDNLNWVAYKQSYFSSILRPSEKFKAAGSSLKVTAYKTGDDREWSHLKDYSSYLSLPVGKVDGQVKMNWFFGPNDNEVLKSYHSDYDDILNYGWGIFRWINLYAVQPLFNLLTSTGMGVGIAILLLTIILKLVLMPIQWKMYVSSAKMRILKPEIEEINKKYPDKSDAMKKQMDMMTLYRESGASPLSGCVPMLIQMPILLAVFRFFPASFEIRQKSFLWASDLSSYDSIYNFGTYIWPYGDHISLFTLLMAGTTLLYTHINSGNVQQPQQPGMPNMKVIMYIFPVMMIFFFNNYAAGLSYYYFISTLMSIIIMIVIKQFFVDEEKLKAKMAAKKAAAAASPGKSGKKKSKFQERLEQMQKAQQEQMKNRKR